MKIALKEAKKTKSTHSVRIFKFAYFDYLQNMHLKKQKDESSLMNSTLQNFGKDKHDEDFFSDLNLIILAIELKVYNWEVFDRKNHPFALKKIQDDENLRSLDK